jgi:hypothetical protein
MTRCCSFLVSLLVMAIAMASRTTQAMTTVSETEAPPQTKPPADMIEEDVPIVLLEKSDFDGDFDVTAAPSPAPSSLSSFTSSQIEPPATLLLPQKTHSPTYITYIPEYFLEAADAMTAPPSSAPTVKPAKDTTTAKPTEKPTEKPTFPPPPPQTESPTTTTPPLIKLVGAQAPTAAPTTSPSLMLLLEEEDCNNDVVAQTSGSTVCPNNNNNNNDNDNDGSGSSSIVHAIGDAVPTAAWSTGEGLLYDFQLLYDDNSVSFRLHNPFTTSSSTMNVYVELETTTTSGGFVTAHCQSAKNLSHCASENENDDASNNKNNNNLFVAACRPNHHHQGFALVKIFLESTASELLEIVAAEGGAAVAGTAVVPKCCHSDDNATMADDDGIHRNVVELVYKIDCSCSAAAILERHRHRRRLRGNATAVATVANTAI